MLKTARTLLVALVAVSTFALAACDDNPKITTVDLPGGIVGQAYNAQLEGDNVDQWSITAGNLPPGLALSTTGAITGTPTTAGTFTFTVTAAPDTSPTSPMVSRQLSITISAG